MSLAEALRRAGAGDSVVRFGGHEIGDGLSTGDVGERGAGERD